MKPKVLSKSRKLKRIKVRWIRITMVFTVITLLLAVGILGLSRNSSQASQEKPQGSKKKYVATKEVIFDEAVSQLRKPTPEEVQQIVDQVTDFTNRSAENRSPEPSANGGIKMSLEGGLGGVVLARANADGTIEVRCVMSMEEAAEFLGLEESSSQD